MALLRDGERANIPPPLGLGFGLVRRRGRRGGRRVRGRRGGRLRRHGAELRGEARELGLLVRELHLELPRVDALGRGHEDALAEQLHLELELMVCREQPRVVGGELVSARVCGGKLRLERDEPRP